MRNRIRAAMIAGAAVLSAGVALAQGLGLSGGVDSTRVRVGSGIPVPPIIEDVVVAGVDIVTVADPGDVSVY